MLIKPDAIGFTSAVHFIPEISSTKFDILALLAVISPTTKPVTISLNSTVIENGFRFVIEGEDEVIVTEGLTKS